MSPPFLTFVLDGNEWSVSHTDCFASGTHCIGNWVGSSAGDEKTLVPAGNKSPAVQPVASHYICKRTEEVTN
jgi:hypothetical protein